MQVNQPARDERLAISFRSETFFSPNVSEAFARDPAVLPVAAFRPTDGQERTHSAPLNQDYLCSNQKVTEPKYFPARSLAFASHFF
jgi:hypothetical protein